MIVLTLRTDKPKSEAGLFKANQQLSYETWPAHRQLAETIHLKIKATLDNQELALENLDGIICYKGPGSFTGLRIGLTVADTLAYSLDIPIVGQTGEDWINEGLRRLKNGETDTVVLPKYGQDAHTTQPKK